MACLLELYELFGNNSVIRNHIGIVMLILGIIGAIAGAALMNSYADSVKKKHKKNEFLRDIYIFIIVLASIAILYGLYKVIRGIMSKRERRVNPTKSSDATAWLQNTKKLPSLHR